MFRTEFSARSFDRALVVRFVLGKLRLGGERIAEAIESAGQLLFVSLLGFEIAYRRAEQPLRIGIPTLLERLLGSRRRFVYWFVLSLDCGGQAAHKQDRENSATGHRYSPSV